ncbi:hypothetical protein Tco_0381700 [Tanacetum coccineum]
MSMWIISRGVVLLILLMEYKVLRDFLLHRSSINNSARLSNKFGGFYFSFKFDISGLLHHVITTIAYRIRDKDTSQSKQNLQSSSMTFIHKTLIIPSVLDSCFISSTVSEVKRYSAYVRRIVADFSHAPPNEYSPSPDDKKQWSLVYPTSVRVFPDPILFLVGLQPSWEHGQQRPVIMVDGKGRFVFWSQYWLAFHVGEYGAPSIDAKPVLKLAKDTADSGGSLKTEVFVVHPGSVAALIKDRKCKTRGGSSMPPVKRKLVHGSLSSRATRAKASSSKDDTPFLMVSDDDEGLPDVFELKYANVCHLNIFAITVPAWKNHLDNHMDVELLDLHDLYYARTSLWLQCARRCLQANLDMILLESQKWAGYQVNHSALESKVASLEAEKARLEATKASLKKEVDDVKRDRIEVILKVVPYAALELVADMKDPFNLSKVKGYRPSYKKEHTQAGNDLAIATFLWLSEATPSSAPASNIMFPHAAVSSVKPQSSQGFDLQNKLPVSLSESRTKSPNFILLCCVHVIFSNKALAHRDFNLKTISQAEWCLLLIVSWSAKIPSLKCFSSFELTVCATLNLHIMYSYTNFCACLQFIVVSGFASTHFVECSTNITRNFKPPRAIGRGPRILTSQWLNGHTLPVAIASFPAAFLAVDCSLHFE